MVLFFTRNSSNQYTHDAITTFFAGVRRVLKSTYNPGDPGNGMEKLLISSTATPPSLLARILTLQTHLSPQPPLTMYFYPHLFPFPAHSDSKPCDASMPANTKGPRPQPTTSSLTSTSHGWRTNAQPPLKPTSSTHDARAINTAHTRTRKPTVTLLQASKNTGYALATNIRRTLRKCLPSAHQVTFQAQAQVRYFHPNNSEPMITYDSGADGHYLSEADRHLANLPILRPSTKRVGVANGSTSMGKHATTLPFSLLSQTAAAAYSFDDFPTSLMSVGKTSDDGTISIFTKDGVTIHKEQDVLITCHGKPLLIGVRDVQGRYRIPLVQHRGQWQPRIPTKKARTVLSQAHSVYDLPSTEQAIKWMHAVCGYPVKSTWLKAVQAGNFIGWPLLTAKNVQKYYPDSTETPRGHLNQTHKNVRSTKPKPAPFEEIHSNQLRGRKVHDIYTTTYEVRDTIFTDQTGQFPVRSLAGNKYIIVMVEIDSSAILVEPIKNRTDAELTRAYSALMLKLRRAGIVPGKHVLDNEISAAMKDLIQDTYKMSLELVPPGCHRRNAAEVAIRNFKSHFLSVLAGVADDFPLTLWDKLLYRKPRSLSTYFANPMPPPLSPHTRISTAPSIITKCR
eukprot:CCRYP_018721-RA/>CCRYP_018721-RA protein AED:0.43 eAED:0.43 QI:0/0/0/1/0/0/2/0/620